MTSVMLRGRPVTVRPLTVRDIGVLGESWAAALAALRRAETLGEEEVPTMLAALLPCLACMTDLSREELATLALPEVLALVRAAVEVHRRPFAVATW